MHQWRRDGDGLLNANLDRPTKEQRVALHFSNRGAREKFERHQRRHGIPRQPEPRRPFQQTEAEWRPWPEAHAPETQLHPQFIQHASRVIVRAYRHASGGEQQVAVTRAQTIPERDWVVPDRAEGDGFRAGLSNRCFQRIAVRADDARTAEHLLESVDVHQLVAGCEHRDSWASKHANRCRAH